MKAFPDQDHDAHIAVHSAYMNSKVAQLQPALLMTLEKHIYEHLGMKAQVAHDQQMAQDPQMMQMQQQMMQLPPEQQQQLQQQMQIQQQAQVATVIADLMQQINEQFAPPPPQEDPLVELRRQELDIKAGDLQRKQQEFGEKQNLDIMKVDQQDDIAKDRINLSEDIAVMKNETAQDRLDQAERFKAADLQKENRT